MSREATAATGLFLLAGNAACVNGTFARFGGPATLTLEFVFTAGLAWLTWSVLKDVLKR